MLVLHVCKGVVEVLVLGQIKQSLRLDLCIFLNIHPPLRQVFCWWGRMVALVFQ